MSGSCAVRSRVHKGIPLMRNMRAMFK
jgi:hypothetical protein